MIPIERKCLKCGSSKVVEVLYDKVTSEQSALIAKGKLRYNEHYYSPELPDFACAECNYNWNRMEEIKYYYGEFLEATAYIGGEPGSSYFVKVDFIRNIAEWQSVERIFSPRIEKREHKREINLVDYYDFYNRVADINPLDWDPLYLEFGYVDGISWGFQLVTDKTVLTWSGMNKFPENWLDFCRMIKSISGRQFESY